MKWFIVGLIGVVIGLVIAAVIIVRMVKQAGSGLWGKDNR